MGLLLLIGRVVLAVVFAVAGVGKLSDLAGSRKSIVDFGAPQMLAPFLGFCVPILELVCALALMIPTTARWGAAGVLTALLLFTAAIAVNMARDRRPECHCFGQLHSAPVGWKTLTRNMTLIGISVFVVRQRSGAQGASIGASLIHLTRLEWIVVGLGLAGAAGVGLLLVLVFHLLRSYGRLLIRVESVEAKLGINRSAPPPSPGLPVDALAPAFSLPTLEGRALSLDVLKSEGAPVLLTFTEPACGACDSLLPDIAQWQRQHAERLTIALITGGTQEANRAKSGKYGLRNTLLQKDREVSEAYKVAASPSAVLIIDGRVASELAVGPDPIRGLVARLVLPRVAKGDSAPALRLQNLEGKTVNLTELRGRRTLLTFWNPSCGFCQNMLPDLKKWEQTPLNDGPRLLVVSSGSVEENRQQAFRAPVLLDPALSAMHVFGARGTPSAVMLDEEGRVASEVEVGADAVLALAGVVRLVAR